MFALRCVAKDCHKLTDPLLDVDTNEVICGDCGSIIPNVTSFYKKQLADFKRIKKPTKNGKAFTVFCKACKSQDVPTLKESKGFCSKCDEELPITPHFINLLKLKLGNHI
jgi:hypothetical protein